MRMLLLPLLAAISTPALAQDYGGAGLTIHQAFVPYTLPSWAGGADVAAPGLMNCIGGVGYGVHDGIRTGAMGAWCGGSRARTGFAGFQGGWQTPRAGLYTAVHTTLGGGWMGLDHEGESLRSTYFFARPTVSLGVPIGELGAVEFGAFAQLQIPLADSLNGRPVDGSAFPHAGLEVSFLFGDFSRKKRTARLGPPQDQATFDSRPPPLGQPEAPQSPPAAPSAPPPQPAPIQPDDTADGDRPLAIPQPDQPRRPPRK